jgi:hypothetical protein
VGFRHSLYSKHVVSSYSHISLVVDLFNNVLSASLFILFMGYVLKEEARGSVVG